MIGGRPAVRTALRRLLSAATARELEAFVVPGPEVARTRGVDLEAAGLSLAETPRHASVLALVGELPEGLREAAVVVYSQMPRPRAILAIGTRDTSPLPAPDASVAFEQGAADEGVRELRRIFAQEAFGSGAEDFDAGATRTNTRYICPMHPEVASDAPGTCPICGMELAERQVSGAPDSASSSGEGSGDPEAVPTGHGSHGSEDPGEYHGPGNGRQEDEAGGQDHMGHSDMGHGGMDHGEMDFMSMVEMTRDLPRSSDGLQMEWVAAPFGPLFRGLPGGLLLQLTLDGDTVAEARASSVIGSGEAGRDSLLGLSAADFAQTLSRLSPLSPVSYRQLAVSALESAMGLELNGPAALARVGALERERAVSHLGWLSGFGHLLGYEWLEQRAGRLQLAVARVSDPSELSRLRAGAEKLSRRTLGAPLLRRKLDGAGYLTDRESIRGPVARAAGLAADARVDGPDGSYRSSYHNLGFEPVVRDGADALARLRVRLAELEASLTLARWEEDYRAGPALPDEPGSGTGTASVETPRGTATLRVSLEAGVVEDYEISTPSEQHLGLVSRLTEGRELADALLAGASLDLSPWEVAL